MQYVILDLEWNGVYSKRLKRYFNEIIEFGAVRLDQKLHIKDTFRMFVRPQVTSQLSKVVTDLTSLSMDDLDQGFSFPKVVRHFSHWIGSGETILMTWGDTDLHMLLENCQYFFHKNRIPFLNQYADVQQYCQSKLDLSQTAGLQLGLSKAAQQMGMNLEQNELHRALDDSRVAGEIFAQLFDEESFQPYVKDASVDEFYDRLTFKNTVISDIESPLIDRSALRFCCPECGDPVDQSGPWLFRHRSFRGDFLCPRCQKKYHARVQFKQTYDGMDIKRSILPCKEEPSKEEESQPTVQEGA